MTSRSSHAYVLSAVLHGAIIATVFLLAYLANQSVMNAPKVFELVAGSGNDYMATEAPNLGVPGGIKVAIPDVPAPTPAAPLEVAPPPEPVAPAAIEPAPAPAPAEPVHTVPAPKATPAPTKRWWVVTTIFRN